MSDLDTLLSSTKSLFDTCRVELKGGTAYRSTPAEGQLPWLVTREQAFLVVGLSELGDVDAARQILRSLLALQLSNGRWEIGYQPNGAGREGPGVIESTATSVWAMLKYADLASDQQFTEAVEARIRRALDGLIDLLHPQIRLPLTRGDLLAPGRSAGYSLWSACAAGAALKLAADLYRERDYDEVYGALRHGIEGHLVYDGRFVPRLDREGRPDYRPTISLLAPALFELWEDDDERVTDTVNWVRTALVDRRVKGYMPFVTFSAGVVGAFPSVWPLATAWLARVLHRHGEREEADKLLRWQLGSMVQGALPKEIVTHQGFAVVEQQRDAFLRSAGESWPSETLRAVLTELAEQRADRSLLYAFSPHLLTQFETVRAFAAGGYLEEFSVRD